jgi:hypothetical protein
VSLLGGILKGVVGFATGGPAGAIAGVASEIFKPKATAATPMPMAKPIVSTFPVLKPAINVAQAFPVLPGVGVVQRPDSTVVRQGGSVPGLYQGGSTTTTYYSPEGGAMQPGNACHVGYHWNRTGYFTKSRGWVPKGTVCVKNRRRNPLNPRALSKALSRLTSAKRAVTVLDRIEVKPRRSRRR